jgi:enoyl-CoA hydratase/carnithine racemase
VICDLTLQSAAELPSILTNLRQAPIAAVTLVQLLRLSNHLPTNDALVAESLAYATLQAGSEFSCWRAATTQAPEATGIDAGPAVLTEREGDSLNVRLNRPSRRNTIDVEMRDALCEAFALAASDPDVRRIRLSGAGRCFSIGGDLTEFGSRPDPATAHAIRSVRLPSFYAARCARHLEARLHGACIGAGIELPAFAARVTATSDAFFQLPELRFGLIPGAGGTVSLRCRIGRHRTAWLALSGRRIDARTALAWGLVDEVVD